MARAQDKAASKRAPRNGAANAGAGPLAPGDAALSPREARRQLRIDMGREQILDTAEQLFGERGYHDTGLKEVAERCEFSVGSLYSYFDGKDALYQEVLRRRSLGQVEEMRRLAADPASADKRLVAMARLQVEYFRTYPNWGRLTTRALTPGLAAEAEVQSGFREAYRDAIDLEAQLIATGQREGVLRAGDPHALARMFSALVTAFHLMDPEVSDDPADLGVEEFLTFIAETFAARPSVVRRART
jgi:AcrR family transcriptional regulator